MEEYHLPTHPLYERGYLSIGCATGTIAVGSKNDDRAGCWAGRELHTDLFKHKELAEVKDQFVLKPEESK